jgi:hypothetical protein
MADSAQVNGDEVLGGKVVRRVVLFQVDLDTPEASLAFGNAIGAAGIGVADIRINQPDDYDSPSSDLYWRNILKKFNLNPDQDGYKSNYKKVFQKFIENLYRSIDSLELKKSRSLDGIVSAPFIELSDLIVGGLEDYSSVLDETNNTLKFSVVHPTIMVGKTFVDMAQASSVFESINVRENDILMVRTSYNGGPFKPEFIGQITSVNPSYRYGAVIKLAVEVAGLSKALYTSQIITKRALNTDQFLPNIEINSVSEPTVFDGRFNPKTAKAIFKELMGEALLSLPKVKQPTPGTDVYELNQGFFNAGLPQGFQFDFFLFLGLYIMSKTPGVGDLWSQMGPDQPPVLLDQDIRALQEAGDYKVFNPMVAKGFSTFFSQLQYPHEVLDQIRNNTFMDIFEARNGIIISRPPRYNRIDLAGPIEGSGTGDYNLVRISAEKDDDTLQQVFTATPGVGWLFNPNGDFFIKSDDLVGDIDVNSDELDVETRIDTKWSMPLNQAPEIAAGSWTDPTLLIRYGFRSKAPVTNPNVLNPRAARLFSPIALAWANAKTRRFNLSAKDTRVYYPGRLYYIEALNLVGFLVGEKIVHGYDKISQRTLTFSMSRKVVSRSVKDILSSENELYNFALCYCNDITPEDLKDNSTAKKRIRDRGRALLARMEAIYSDTLGATYTTPTAEDPGITQSVANDQNGNQVQSQFTPPVASQRPAMTVPMFKYLPTILDLIIEVEVDKTLADLPSAPKDNSNLKKTQDNGTGNEVAIRDSQGRLYCPFLLYNFPQPFDDFGKLVSSPDRDKFLDSPKSLSAGAIAYGPVQSAAFMQVNPSKSTHTNKDFEGVLALRTPFLDAQFVANLSKFSMSQLLINMLVSLDLLLKYSSIGGFFTDDAIGGDVPQFFIFNQAGGFDLFFPGSSDPTFDRTKLAAKWSSAVDRVQYNLKDLSGNSLPANILRLKLDSANMPYFENKYFEIKPTAAGEYNMPMGYFVTFNNAVGWQFFRVANKTDGSAGGRLKKFNVFSQSEVQMEAVDSGLDFDVLPLSSRGDYGIYYVTPFGEATIERLMEFFLPPKKAGQFDATDVNNLKAQVKASRPAAVLLEENQSHSRGRAVDLSPDYLVASSRSDLTMKGSKDWNSGTGAIPPLLSVFQDRLVRAHFSLSAPPNSNTPAPEDPKKRSFFFPIKSAMTATTVYPNGQSAGQHQLAFFHLEVSQADISAFKRWLLPPREGNENLYSPEASKEIGGNLPVQDAVAPGTSLPNSGGING